MAKRLHNFIQAVLVLLTLAATGQEMFAQCGPGEDMTDPTFVETAPANVTVCFGDIPEPIPLIATDNCDGNFPVTPVDARPSDVTLCSTGGNIRRQWRAIDQAGNDNPVTEEQFIMVTPDNSPPAINYSPNNVVDRNCTANGFQNWVTQQLQAIANAATDDCGIDTIFSNAPATHPGCGQTVTVTFTVRDVCQNMTTTSATYTIEDTQAPTLQGVPDDLALECGATIPTPPVVTATDNCSGAVTVTLMADTTVIGTGDCADYVVTRTWMATDACNNTVSDFQIITVRDTEAPTFVEPADVEVACGTDLMNLPGLTNVRDNCNSGVSFPANPNAMGTAMVQVIHESPSPVPSVDVYVDGQLVLDNFSYRSATNFVEVPAGVPLQVGLAPGNSTSAADTVSGLGRTFILPMNTVNIIAVHGVFGSPTTPVELSLESMARAMATQPDEFDLQFYHGSPTGGKFTVTEGMTVLFDTVGYGTFGMDYISFSGNMLNVDVTNSSGAPIGSISVSLDITPYKGQSGVMVASGYPGGNPAFQLYLVLADGTIITVPDNTVNAPFYSAGDIMMTTTLDTVSMECDSFIVQKMWRLEDACGNVSTAMQTIRLVDTVPPTFTVPADLTIDCEQVNDTMQTGSPTMIGDNCDANPTIDYVDIFTGGGCASGGVLERIWMVTDACGNMARDTQRITIIDTVNPTVTIEADNLSVMCSEDLSIVDTFSNWIAAHGNAIATDNCSPDTLLTWTAFNAGTNTPASLPAPSCPSPQAGVYLTQMIDFVVTDECGNKDTTTATFTVMDNMAPVFEFCPSDTAINNMPGDCGSDFVLPLPVVTEECGMEGFVNVSMMQPIVSNLPGDEETPVNPIQYNFSVPTLPTYAIDSVVLRVRLLSVDGNQQSEYFNIVGEDGTILGRTAIVTNQCDASTTQVLTISPAQVNVWAVDGTISLMLRPNIPDNQPGRFAINDICPGSQAEVSLAYKTRNPQNVVFAYSINSGARMNYDPTQPAPMVTLDGGFSMVKYFATDCAGNIDSCSMIVTVNDVEAPTFACPADVTSTLSPNTCMDTLTLDLPTNLVDNCDMPADLMISYYTTGATSTGITSLTAPATSPEVVFNGGLTEVFYVVEDLAGNRDTCSFNVTVIDDEPPVARCGSTTIFINPSGVLPDTISAMEINNGSTDNCMIDRMTVSPSVFTCDLAGQDTVNVTLTVFDVAGNSNSCTVPVRVVTESPEPTYFIQPCGGDTLFLFANPPAAPGNIIYTYRWTGPNGFVSNRRNPFIPNPDEDNAGSYEVIVTGITGCIASGTVEVAISDVPITPTINGPNAICSDEDLILTTTPVPLNNVQYQWYVGLPPNGTLLQTTTTPTLMLAPPHSAGNKIYYTVINVNGCLSVESPAKTVQITAIPDAVVVTSPIEICEGEPIMLEAQESTTTGLTYSWTGPNGFMSNSRLVTVTQSATLANNGVYNLVVSRNGCSSIADADSRVQVVVSEQPSRPLLTNNGPVCQGGEVTLITNISNATTYHWVAPDFTERITPTNRLTLSGVTPADAGNWTVYVTRGGCDSEVSAPSAIVINAMPSLTVSANPSPVCSGTTLELFASPSIPGATYQWTGPDGYFSAAQNPVIPNMTIARAGTYTATITTQSGCSTTRSVEVEVLQGVTIVGISSDGEGCLTGARNVRLAVTTNPPDDGTYTYRWTGPNGYTSTNRIAVIPNATESDNGNYQVIVTNAGCASNPATTTIAIRRPPATPAAPSISPQTPAPFCEGETMILTTTGYSGTDVLYSWDTPLGVVTTRIPSLTVDTLDINDSGSYSVVVTVDGCTSNASGITPIKVNPNPVVKPSSNSPVCAGGTLNLTVDPIPGATYAWDGPSGLSSASRAPTYTNVSPQIHEGLYTIVATVDGCQSEPGIVEVDIIPIPGMPVAFNNGPICVESDTMDTELRLAVSAASSTPGAAYNWYDQNGNRIGDTATTNLVLRVSDFDAYTTGIYSFTVEAVVGNCVSERSEPTLVEINVIPEQEAFAGEDFSICRSQTVMLNARPPQVGQGFWEVVSGDSTGVFFINPDSPTTEVIGIDDASSYSFSWNLLLGSCGIYSRDTVVVTLDGAEVADAGEQIDTCQVTALRLNATQPAQGEGIWTQSEAQAFLGIVIIDPDDPNTEVMNLQPGNNYFFTWTLMNSECGSTSDDVQVLVSGGFPYAGEDFSTCKDDCVELNATPPSTGVGRWSSPDAGIIFNSRTDPKTTVCGLEEGTNILVWTVDNDVCGAASRDSVIVTLADVPVAVDDNVTVPADRSVNIDVAQNDTKATVYTVTIATDPVNGEIERLSNGVYEYMPNPGFRGTDQFTYSICNNACACDTSTVTITIVNNTRCSPPNIFTPNNDGINDAFMIPCFTGDRAQDFKGNEVIILNQWGDEVFRATDYKNDWEGTYNGEDLPNGTYFYIVKYGSVEFGAKVERGYVHIQR